MAAVREVVVTGVGAVTPFGVGVDSLWKGVCEGRSSIDWLSNKDELDPEQFPVRYAGEVKAFDVRRLLVKHCDVRREKGVQMALVAAQEALMQADLIDNGGESKYPQRVISTFIGSGQGACHEEELVYHSFTQRGVRGLRPTSVPRCMYNAFSSNVSIHFGLRGPNHTIASACSSGLATIGIAYRDIKHGYADLALVGGADSPISQIVFACWTSLGVLAEHSVPAKACRPFDKQRSGMAIGEGAGILVLESRESADRRGVPILARVAGYGTSSDAHHITAPRKEGQVAAIQQCLADADVIPAQVDYINMHGTGTLANDEVEAHSVKEVFGPRGSSMPTSSTKAAIGHSLGAIGAIETILCMQSLRSNFVPPTLNCDEPDPNVGLDYVPHVGREHGMRYAISNSFAFGGSNAVILLERAT